MPILKKPFTLLLILGVRLGVVGILAREDVKVLTVYVDLSVICVICVICITNLTATNINLNTIQDTKIKGANLQATNQLNLNTKNLLSWIYCCWWC
jgi:hypothetical protein